MSHPPPTGNDGMACDGGNSANNMHFQMAQQQQQQGPAAYSGTTASASGAPNTVKLSKIIACEIKVHHRPNSSVLIPVNAHSECFFYIINWILQF